MARSFDIGGYPPVGWAERGNEAGVAYPRGQRWSSRTKFQELWVIVGNRGWMRVIVCDGALVVVSYKSDNNLILIICIHKNHITNLSEKYTIKS